MVEIIESRRAEQQAAETYKNDHGTDGLAELQRVQDVIAQYQCTSTALDRGTTACSCWRTTMPCRRFSRRLAQTSSITGG